ncbi:MAG: NTP transferase domain-containing protein [Clostridiales bacterium]|nr:NTP transferase domain-containing protein [Clostridiales bacterium]
MSKQALDILLSLNRERYTNQRELAEKSGLSLGFVNKSLKLLEEKGLIGKTCVPTAKAKSLIRKCSPQRAVILAAGIGMRMVPINTITPKALLDVKGEVLIERQIRQLHEAGITDISVVAGFMKEAFEYLVDKFNINLISNEYYASRNNIYSVSIASDRLSNCYIVPCDIWSRNNPFSRDELYSWYMVSDCQDKKSSVRINRKNELVRIPPDDPGNRMIGISYLLKEDAETVSSNIRKLLSDGRHEESFWEEALFDDDRMFINARLVSDDDVREINTYEQLREIDSGSDHLKNDAIKTISKVFGCEERDIKDISVLKKGMTNRSFLFSLGGSKYIMRIPGEGTDLLINRKQEKEVYETISGLGLCDDPIYINPDNGYKITKYLEGIRVCDCNDELDLTRCMKKLREFHEMELKVDHEFDIFAQIEFYESLWNGMPSVFRDYADTKSKVMSLKGVIAKISKKRCLTHIDAVPDNFLFYMPAGSKKYLLQLTDWEYSGMQDPHVDIAMFCIYSLFDKNGCDHLIDIYFDGKCDTKTRGKIYCYIASCGLLWSNWCEYKRSLGVEFGDYNIRQYRYAKEFYRYAMELL